MTQPGGPVGPTEPTEPTGEGGGFAHEFELDPFQRDAIAALDAGRNVLVAAPTGAGKTVVAEHAVDLALRDGRRCFYTAPIKALSNQKFADLRRVLGEDHVGLLTGDHSIAADAPVVVMTTEVLRNMIYARSGSLDRLGWVVLDEVHFLQDAYRGPVWEEVLIHTPPGVGFVCLSATVSNAAELGAWITELRGPTDTVVEHERPIRLDPLLLVGDRSAEREHLVPLLVDGRANPEGHRFDADPPARRGGPPSRGPRGRRSRFRTPRRVEVIDRLDDEDLLPSIYFIFSRNACDDAARACLDGGVRLTDGVQRRRIRAIAEHRTAALGDEDLGVLGYDSWLATLEQGIGSHHAGMVPAFREAVEECFNEGLLGAVFATETLALGINMPARSVVIERLSKFNGERHEFLSPGQFTQLTGRAGRRGIDEAGSAVVLWSPFVTFEPGRVARGQPRVPPLVIVPPHVQHDRQPGGTLRPGGSRPGAAPLVRAVPGGPSGRGTRVTPRPPRWRARGPPGQPAGLGERPRARRRGLRPPAARPAPRRRSSTVPRRTRRGGTVARCAPPG